MKKYTWIYILFAPFFLAGCYALIKQLRLDNPDPEKLAVSGVFIFISVLFGIGIHFGLRRVAKTDKIKLENPGKPWLWREDWLQKYANPQQTYATAVSAGIGILLIVILAPLYLKLPEMIRQEKYQVLIALIFPVVGLWMLGYSLFSYIRSQKFGLSRLYFHDYPALGSSFKGTLIIATESRSEGKVKVVINSKYTYTSGSGKNRSKHTKVNWQLDKTFDVRSAGRRMEIPIEFDIPYDLEPTSDEPSGSSFNHWDIQVELDLPGIDFKAGYDIPVFYHEKSDENLTQKTVETGFLESEPDFNSVQDWKKSEFIEVNSIGSETEVRFPKQGAWNMAIGILIMGIIFSAVGGFIGYKFWVEKSLFVKFFMAIFPLVFGGFGGIFLLIGIATAVGRSRLVIDRSGLRVVNRYLIFSSSYQWNWEDIETIDMKSTMSSGHNKYYSLQIKKVGDKRPRTIPCHIPSKTLMLQFIEWVQEQSPKRQVA